MGVLWRVNAGLIREVKQMNDFQYIYFVPTAC